MISLQKIGDSAVKFVFTDSDHYLYGNGEIEVPVNSLLLVIDESDMVTFKKLSGDPFLSFRADNSNLGTKAAIEQFYKDNMVGSTGGGSESGITPSEVQTMIDNSLEDYYTDDEVDAALSGKASVSDVTAVANDVQTVSGQVATKVAITDFNAYSAATDARIAEDKEVTAAALNDLQENKADTSAVTAAIDAATSGKADTTYVNQIATQATSAITELNTRIGTVETNLGGQIETLNANKFGYASYDSQTQRINFYSHSNSTDVLTYIDASAFIKDGMVSNVEIVNGNLVITFNSDAGKQPISIPLTDIFNPANYYTTAQTQSYVSGFTYDKATIDQKVAEGGTFDPDLYYDKTATDALLAAKADTATTYTKTEVDAALSGKVDTSAITTSITSGSTDSEIPTAKAVYDAIPTGGGGGMDDDMEKLISSSLNDLNDRKIDASEVMTKYQRKGDYATNTALALKANSADVMTLTKSEENEFVAASALVDLNNKFGGLSLVKITESDYAALTTKDDNTLYIVVADPT